jgi:hypothetical protein
MADSSARGIDVSHYQGTVDWQGVRMAGIQFAFAKATEGVTWTDPEFGTNWPGMRAAGLLRGAYHFFEPNDDAGQQAAFFLQTVQLEAGDLPPVLDVETEGTSPQALWQGVQTWLEQVEAAVGLPPILYMSPTFANENEVPASLASYHPGSPNTVSPSRLCRRVGPAGSSGSRPNPERWSHHAGGLSRTQRPLRESRGAHQALSATGSPRPCAPPLHEPCSTTAPGRLYRLRRISVHRGWGAAQP